MTDTVDIDPTAVRSGAVLSLIIGALAVASVAPAPGQLVALGAELVALLLLCLGGWRLRAGAPLSGLVLVAAGVIGTLAAFGAGVAWASGLVQRTELLPGMLGLAILALGVMPVTTQLTRFLIGTGVVAVGAGVLLAGLVHGAGGLWLLVGMALSVVAWDVATQAVSLGEQVGRHGGGLAVVGTHGAWTAAVGAAGVATARTITAIDVTGLPLIVLGLLLSGALALAAAAFT